MRLPNATNKALAGVAALTLAAVTAVAGHAAFTPKPAPSTPVPAATAPTPPSPGQLLNLGQSWKLTLPTGDPTEIDPTALGTFSDPNWFHTTPDGGVAFRAPVNGATTSGSDYPRSELREMAPRGKLASWSAKTGTHTLVVNEAFTALPAGKPQVVGAQIHDSSKDWTTFRLEGTKLWVTQSNNTHYRLADSAYVLGTRFEAKFVVENKQIKAFYNGRLVATLDATKLKSGYFKAGVYTQANCSNSAPCSAGNFGEVVIYSLNGPAVPTPAPTPVPGPPPAGGCTISPTETLLDQDPSDSQSPWRRTGGQRVVVNLETHAVTDPTYRDDMVKGVTAWSGSPCVVPQLVDTCAPNTNCVHVVLKATGPAGDDGNFNDITSGGYTIGGTIEYYTGVLAKEGPGAQLNVVTHEMGHALGLRHRLTKHVLMNGDTYPDVFLPDATDLHNLLVEYANQRP